MAPRSRGGRLALLALLVLLLGVAAVGASSGSEAGVSQLNESDLQAGNTTLWIQLQSDGDARWTVTMSVALPEESDQEAFADVGDRFEAGESDLLSVETFRQFVALSRETTGREMELHEVSRESTVTDETGELTLSFTWTDFGRRDGDQLSVGDAFDATDGTWLRGLTDDQQLVIGAPDSFDIVEAPQGITIRNETVRWTGPTEFDPGYLSVTYASSGATTTTATTTGTGTTTGTTDTTTAAAEAGDLPLFGIGVLLFVIAVAVLYAIRHGGNVPFGTGGSSEDDEPPTDDDGGALPREEPTATHPEEPDPSTESESEPGGPGATTAPDDEPDLDRELLSDEEYVEALIEHNGGRMKQADIVSETGWSNAKVSQLLSAMAEDGQIEKLRIGRENLISFPDEETES